MPMTYTASALGISRSTAIEIIEPVGLDARSSASVRTPLEKLANLVKWLYVHAGIQDDGINTWTYLNTFDGPADDEQAAIGYGGAITARKIWANFGASNGTANGRIVLEADGTFSFCVNARWNRTGTNAGKWTLDNAAADAIRLKLNGSNGHVEVYTKASGSAAWVDGSWALGTYIAGGALHAGGQLAGDSLFISNAGFFGAFGASAGGGSTLGSGDVYREAIDFAGGLLDGSPTIVRAMNVTSVTKIGGQTGLYKVTLKAAAPNKLVVSSLVLESQSPAFIFVDQTHPYEITTSTFHFRVYTAYANSPVDLSLTDVVHFTCKAY